MSSSSCAPGPREAWLRGLLVAAALVLAQLPAVGASADAGVCYISPTGAGARDGSSWADAATLDQLPAMIARAGAGGRVLLRAGQGAYRPSGSLSVRSGGATGRPVTIRGAKADGSPATATIRGTRTDPYSPSGDPGVEVVRLLTGADHLSFQYLSFVDVGNGGIRVGADIADLDIEHVKGRNVRRLLEDYASGDATNATISGLTVRDVTVAGFSRSVARLQYDTHDVLMEDVTGDSQRQDGDQFAIGVQLDGTVHDVTLRRVTMNNCTDTTNSYWNGDGFAAEENTHDLRLEDTQANGNTDAGYDIKAHDSTLVRTSARDNKRNYRFWGADVTAVHVTAEDPMLRGGEGSQAQFWIGPHGRVTLNDPTASDSRPNTVVYELEAGAQLTVKGGSVTLSSNARYAKVGPDATFNDGTATVQRI